MTQRRKWTAIPGLLFLAIGAVVLSAYSGASSSQGNAPDQPIAFPHPKQFSLDPILPGPKRNMEDYLLKITAYRKNYETAFMQNGMETTTDPWNDK